MNRKHEDSDINLKLGTHIFLDQENISKNIFESALCFSNYRSKDWKSHKTIIQFHIGIEPIVYEAFLYNLSILNDIWNIVFEEIINPDPECEKKWIQITLYDIHNYNELLIIGNLIRLWEESVAFVLYDDFYKEHYSSEEQWMRKLRIQYFNIREKVTYASNYYFSNHFSIHDLKSDWNSFRDLRQALITKPSHNAWGMKYEQ